MLLSSITVSVISAGGLLFTSGSIDAPLYLFAVIIAEGLGSSLLKFTEFMDNFYHIKNGKKMIEEVLSAPELEEAAADKEVKEAARLAQCTEFIEKLENGWNTFAGNEGTKLSGGQRQRIIIARAILRNAPILILDEAVSHTDAENRRQLQLSLQELCKNKTVITIDHSLSTVKESDSIIVMEKGRVHAQGTHTELLEHSEVYKRLWEGKLC